MRTSPTDHVHTDEWEGGFTLLELLVVLSILVLIASITVLKFQPRSEDEIAASALQESVNILRETRAKALAARTDQAVYVDLQKRKLSSTATRQSVTFPTGDTFVLGVADAASYRRGISMVRFFPNGGSSGGAIYLRYGDHERRLRVAWLTGRVTLDAVR
ncbi:prepilin-type N-terminal cleavage/methylation domain-containing protein [Parvibaculum sp.]|uniref:prepilin-type N-terminal cleavage/methylation domain-containing protein n=1 Tax=Parvibaculum sp. TaxID=2024848 RepID=UPI00320DE489